MKSRRKMLSWLLTACMGAAIGFAASANAGDVRITPPPKPAFDTVISPGEVPGHDIEHGHHNHSKDNIKKNKSNNVDELQQTGTAGGQS